MSESAVYRTYRSNTYLFGGNAPYVEEMYENYLANPGSVPENWREYFDNLQHLPALDGSNSKDVPHQPVVNAFAERAKAGNTQALLDSGSSEVELGRKRTASQQLIAAYRNSGARWADLDPLKRTERPEIPELELSFYGFTDADLETVFNTSNTFFGKERMSLRELLNALRETYSGTIGAEFMHTSDFNQKRWWQQKLESIRAKPVLDAEHKKRLLNRLTAAEGLERFLHTKYVGQKRFSLEGGESFIVAMDEVVREAGKRELQEIVIGMAHRGRLNVLVNLLGKMPQELFAEFEHTAPEDLPSGDVKYHQGFSSNVTTPNGPPVHLSLASNPSHLEIVNPVVVGSVRARMDRRGDPQGKHVLPLLVHGDAAFAGQGVVMETLALAETRGYHTGGTLHIVINNQIGFTTSDPRDSRSTLYCTDVVKMMNTPVLHVNGDDPEAVALCVQLAMDYRATFHKDVVIDIVCFRKLGHNEQDTPMLTQPLMYEKISQHPGTRKLYADRLAAQGLGDTLGDEMVQAYRRAMVEGRSTIDPVLGGYKRNFAGDWMPYRDKKWTDAADTAIPANEWRRLAESITTVPENFSVHPLARKVLDDRAAMGRGEIAVDWGMGASIWPLPRWFLKALRCACRAKTAGAARLPTATLCYTTKTARSSTKATTFRCKTLPKTKRNLPLSTPSCLKKPCWVLSTATPPTTRARWLFGRRNLATLPTAPKSLSTNSLPAAKSNGGGSTASRSCCHTATKAKAPSTARHGWSALCNWLPTAICKSCNPPLPARFSTCCAARWCATYASRWLS